MQLKTISQISISAWNVHGLGDKIKDDFFTERIKSDINILLETWKGENKDLHLEGYNSFTKIRKKAKKSRRHSGGIIVFYKKTMLKGITYIKDGTNSNNRLWMKLEKSFFGLDDDIYICAVYIPPVNSNHYNDDYILLEREISHFSNRGKIILLGDFNSRTGNSLDFIQNDDTKLNDFTNKDLLPDFYSIDNCNKRINCDYIVNAQDKSLLDLCLYIIWSTYIERQICW